VTPTDLSQLQRKLATLEGQMRRAREVGGVGMFAVDLATQTVTATPEFFRAFGVPARDGTPATVFERLVHPADAARTATSETRARGTVSPDIEYRIIRPDTGEIRWIARQGEFERDPAGKPLRFVGITRDITDDIHAREALADSEARYRTLFNSIDEGFCIIEFFDGPHGPLSDYVHVEANPAYTLHAGIPNVVGQKVREMVPDEADGWVELYRGVLTTGEPIRFERELVATGRHLELAAFRVEPPSRRQVAVLFQDITERKRAELDLQALNETLEARVQEAIADRLREQERLRQAEEALRQSQKMEAVGQLTGGLAHDFNNLLTGIIGSMELLQTRLAQGRLGEVDRYIVAAQAAARRAASLTHRLLAFSRRQTLDPRPTDVNRLVAGMEELVRRTVGPHITLEVVTAGGLWTALIDGPQLESALLNLCINARDAMPDGGRITIETANKWLDDRAARERDLEPGQYLSICVTDTGTGMSADVIAKAFDPFFTTKPLGQGTGLGLSMVYGFVRQSGGQVRIYSQLGQGTTMCIYLPRHYGSEAERLEAVVPAEPARVRTGETVMIVDDEPTVRMLVTEVLGELGYNALEAGDGAAGLALLQSDERVDLLITDVGLPGGMNGRQLADAARVTRPALKVLFITGYAENAIIGSGQLAPGMQVLTKPFMMEALARRIRDMVEDAG
jgi:PAS domain S-box-containing protein